MLENNLITSLSAIFDLIFLVETWEKDGISISNILGYSHFSTTQLEYGNMHSRTIIRGHGGIVVFIRTSF